MESDDVWVKKSAFGPGATEHCKGPRCWNAGNAPCYCNYCDGCNVARERGQDAPDVPKPEMTPDQGPHQPEPVRCTLGVADGAILLTLGELELGLTADQADQMATDLRTYAIELRNGGRQE